MIRSGIVARKVGMSRLYDADGRARAVTLLDLADCRVVGKREVARDGYEAVQVGVGEAKKRAQKGGARKVVEFRVSVADQMSVGMKLGPGHFMVGQRVDVVGTSIGCGFAGVMKRHNFRGQRASHGAKKVHRQPGSTGQCQDPGRIFKGKKMAGQMGNARVTVQNLQVLDINEEEGWLAVGGGVPGAKGSWVQVKDANKRALPEGIEAVQAAPAPSEEAPAEPIEEDAPQETDAPQEAPQEADAPQEDSGSEEA